MRWMARKPRPLPAVEPVQPPAIFPGLATPGWLLFVPSLPTTGTQKVQKTQIFPRGEDPRARPGAIDLRERKKRRMPPA